MPRHAQDSTIDCLLRISSAVFVDFRIGRAMAKVSGSDVEYG
jgi:hypothetical protein